MSKFRLIFVVLFALFFASSVYAADIAVGVDCSLADAIIAANRDRAEGDCPAGRGTDTITLTQDITLRAELPAITSDITIEGNGYTISGNHRYRIFYNDGGALTINNLTMTKGYVEGDPVTYADVALKVTAAQTIGGAIVNWQGALSISDSAFRDNLAESFGGAIFNAGELSISGSSFSDNWSDGSGGAISNWDAGELSISSSVFSDNSAYNSGAIGNKGELSITDSTFSDNSAKYGGGAILNAGELSIVSSTFNGNSVKHFGGAIFNTGELNISDSTFSHNSASSNSYVSKGGAVSNGEELSITNSTFSDNSADWGGAIVSWEEGELSITNSSFSDNSSKYGGGAISNEGELSIINSTFSGNSADKGGTIFNEENGKLRMRNNIIAGIGGACYYESRLRGNINNFIQDGSCSSDFSGDPKLSKLVVPEDGSPAYFPLLAGSPAIDAADDGYCPATDQIGTERPQGAGCDIGAIEYVAP